MKTDSRTLPQILASTCFRLVPGQFYYLRLTTDAAIPAPRAKFLAIVRDGDETTVVTEEPDGFASSDRYGPMCLIELVVDMPFETVGLLAAATQAIASQGISVLVISTYSKDYLLVKWPFAELATKALSIAGLTRVENADPSR
jgi:hypothetical protein